jgi:hypothetical protein
MCKIRGERKLIGAGCGRVFIHAWGRNATPNLPRLSIPETSRRSTALMELFLVTDLLVCTLSTQLLLGETPIPKAHPALGVFVQLANAYDET